MGKTRLEAFSDGVIAIIITIMVLELKVPHGDSLDALQPLWGVFLSYVLSFVYLGIYWNNHHHMLHTVEKVTGGILWANLHLLFWLSIVPFVTGWMGENHFAPIPTAVYGVVLLMAGASVLDPPADHHRVAGERVDPIESRRRRLERQPLSHFLCGRNCPGPVVCLARPARSTRSSPSSGSCRTSASNESCTRRDPPLTWPSTCPL